MSKLVVGLFFGGRSPEHEVSVISALQAYRNLNQEKYEIIPFYVDKTGRFFTNPKFLSIKNYQNSDSLLLSSTEIILTNGGYLEKGLFKKPRLLDIALPIFHGPFGEDGSIQGLFEIYQIPYVGLNVSGSAVAMDKMLSKALFESLGLPIGKYIEIKRLDWLKDPTKAIKQVQNKLKSPWFVKPGTGGSSIGAGKATDTDSLQFAIEVAAIYSEKIIVEEAFENCIEVNCSVMGYEEIRASVCEMPIPSADILSFADKYQRGGKGSKGAGGMETLTREIPAPIPDKLTKEIQEASTTVFKALDGCGVARIDFFVDAKKQKYWINEVNSPPGSLAFYLWEKTGINYPELLDQLIELGLKRAENKKQTQYTFESGLLSQMAKASKD